MITREEIEHLQNSDFAINDTYEYDRCYESFSQTFIQWHYDNNKDWPTQIITKFREDNNLQGSKDNIIVIKDLAQLLDYEDGNEYDIACRLRPVEVLDRIYALWLQLVIHLNVQNVEVRIHISVCYYIHFIKWNLGIVLTVKLILE